jgi:N-acyl-D-aspartate/D-glutamate deacylase
MTSLNAAKAGLDGRGLLQPGMFADVTVFDPEKILDLATYTDPFRYSEGVEYVLVNGELVLDHGERTAARPGRALRRQ